MNKKQAEEFQAVKDRYEKRVQKREANKRLGVVKDDTVRSNPSSLDDLGALLRLVGQVYEQPTDGPKTGSARRRG